MPQFSGDGDTNDKTGEGNTRDLEAGRSNDGPDETVPKGSVAEDPFEDAFEGDENVCIVWDIFDIFEQSLIYTILNNNIT